MSASRKHRRRIEEICAELGWTIKGFTRNGHYQIVKRGRPIVVASSSPSDRRADKNLRAQLRRFDRQAKSEGADQ